MKTKFLVAILMAFVLCLSCSKDNVDENNSFTESSEITPNLNSNEASRISCNIIAALVEGETCFSSDGTPGSLYSVYATNGLYTVSYDRRVELYLVEFEKNPFNQVITYGDIVDTAFVTIPANDNTSDNAAVLRNLNEKIKNVEVRIANVVNMSTGAIVTECSFTKTKYKPNHCYNKIPKTKPVGFCGGNDSDGDGVCTELDPDDNDPCNPKATNSACLD